MRASLYQKALLACVMASPGTYAQSGDMRPSFDCATARPGAEQAICADAELAGLDRAIADRYGPALAAATPDDAQRLKRDQQRWLARRNTCETERPCLLNQLATRLATLEAAAPQPPAEPAAAPCERDVRSDVLFCNRPDGMQLRVIQNSASPDGNLAFAWGVIPGQNADLETAGDDGTVHAENWTYVRNVLIRIGDGAVLARSPAQHFGDRQQYNHNEHRAAWSPGGGWVAETTHGKWQAHSIAVYRIDGDFTVRGPLDLRAAAIDAAEAEVRRLGLKVQRGEEPLTYVMGSAAGDGDWQLGPTIDDQGNVALKLTAWDVPGRRSVYGFDLRFKITQSGSALKAELIEARRDREDEEP